MTMTWLRRVGKVSSIRSFSFDDVEMEFLKCSMLFNDTATVQNFIFEQLSSK